MHDVGQVQHERRLRDVHARAVRRKGVGHRAHGVLVLLEVLAGARQRRGEGEVVGVVTGAPDGAGEHARRDEPALEPHEHLRRGAEEAVDVERPAAGVVDGQAGQGSADVERLVERGHEVAGQDDLVDAAVGDASDRLGDDVLPRAGVDRAVGERRPCWGTRDDRWRRPAGGVVMPAPTTVTHERPSRRPTTTSGTVRPLPAPWSANVKVPNATNPVPGTSTSSRTTLCRVISRHHDRRLRESTWSGRGERRGTTPADQAVVVVDPGHVVVAGEEGEERPGVVDLDGAGHERQRRRVDRSVEAGVAHGSNGTRGTVIR